MPMLWRFSRDHRLVQSLRGRASLRTVGRTSMDRVLRAILRTELPFFIRKVFATISPGETYLHNWHVDAIAHQLMRVHSGEGRRLLINQPPRSLKSICVSVAYVAWLLGHDPTRRVEHAQYRRGSASQGIGPSSLDAILDQTLSRKSERGCFQNFCRRPTPRTRCMRGFLVAIAASARVPPGCG